MEMIDNDEHWSIFPLTDGVTGSFVDPNNLISMENNENKCPIGMANFRSKNNNNCKQVNPFFRNNGTVNVARMRWKSAAMKVRLMNDPWSEFKIESYPTEYAVRHRYNAIKKKWMTDECIVKMEPLQFANGAMRACFRLKKLSNFVHKNSWEHASNYVAKCYMSSDMPRERYFDDVKLQMDAKLWAEIYNRHNPPKKIDMFQVSILEFKNRPGAPLYHLEHFIEGKYIKYNSNSGFVDDVDVRFTPHAFSHFTFECSNHELIVVDIQGVGDLYTDPQIHTVAGTEYGDGNLGIKGLALFFSSHICNEVCKCLGLTQFDLADSEYKSHEKIVSKMHKFCFTQSRGNEEPVIGSPSSFGEYFRHRIRSRSDNSACSDENNNAYDLPDIYESEGYESLIPSPLLSPNINHNNNNNTNSTSSMPITIRARSNSNSSNTVFMNYGSPVQVSRGNSGNGGGSGRVRTESHCLDSAFSLDEAINYFNAKNFNKPRPSCVFGEKEFLRNKNEFNEEDYGVDKEEESILGRIHLELCKYHEMGRFVPNDSDEFDSEAAFFHLDQAAKLGIADALVNLGKIYLGLPRDILPNYEVNDDSTNHDLGFECMLRSAEKGDKNSMFFVAKAYDSGLHLSTNRSIDWLLALEFYQKILNTAEDEPSAEDSGFCEISTVCCDPVFMIMARMAEINMQGGNGVEPDPSEAASLYNEAAEKATLFGKGRLANKYYMLAEEAASMADDY